MTDRKAMYGAIEEKLKHLFDGVVLPLEKKARILEKIHDLIKIAAANKHLPELLDLDEPAKSG